MHVFYTPDIQTHAELPEEEAAHAVRVLRLQAGDEVMLTDGKGYFYRAEISTATNKRCLVNILETLPQAPLWKGHLHIAMAPTKNMDRTEWFAEKAAVSVRNLDFPRLIGMNPFSSAFLTSSSLKSPSGPISTRASSPECMMSFKSCFSPS